MDRAFERPAWKSALNWTASILIAFLFLSSGIWKISDPIGWSVLLHQLKVPQDLSLPFAVILGTIETVTGVLFLAPGYRRIAAWLGAGLLLVFMAYIGINYSALHGADCSCFPFVKRAVDPAFFWEDGAMIGLALIAGMWASPTAKLHGAFVVLGAVTVFSLVSLGVAAYQQTGTRAPATITVNGKPYDISTGQILLYFYNPECMHCLDAGERMAKLNWGDTKVVGVPVENPQFAPAFNERTGLKAVTTTDFASLKGIFNYKAYPFAVAVSNGREVAALTKFDNNEPTDTLRKLNFAR